MKEKRKKVHGKVTPFLKDKASVSFKDRILKLQVTKTHPILKLK